MNIGNVVRTVPSNCMNCCKRSIEKVHTTLTSPSVKRALRTCAIISVLGPALIHRDPEVRAEAMGLVNRGIGLVNRAIEKTDALIERILRVFIG